MSVTHPFVVTTDTDMVYRLTAQALVELQAFIRTHAHDPNAAMLYWLCNATEAQPPHPGVVIAQAGPTV